jgi:hypothetical protein
MWEPRRLTTLWASTACYRDSFTFFFARENFTSFFFTRYNFTFYLYLQPKIKDANCHNSLWLSKSRALNPNVNDDGIFSNTRNKYLYYSVETSCVPVSHLHSQTTVLCHHKQSNRTSRRQRSPGSLAHAVHPLKS